MLLRCDNVVSKVLTLKMNRYNDMSDTYSEYFIRLDKNDTRHTEIVITECLEVLRAVGLNGIEMEVDKNQGILFISLYPDIIQKQLSENGKQSGRPRKPISTDKNTIKSMIEQYGAEQTAKELGIRKKTMYRRLSE